MHCQKSGARRRVIHDLRKREVTVNLTDLLQNSSRSENHQALFHFRQAFFEGSDLVFVSSEAECTHSGGRGERAWCQNPLNYVVTSWK